MADKPIGQLTAAPSNLDEYSGAELFVLEQNGTAKKLSMQILENWLVAKAEGHGGIQTIAKTGTSGLVDTYTITFADLSTSTFTVTNGNGITAVTQYFAVSSSPSTVPSSWSTTRQTMTSTNRYLWSYFTFTRNSGSFSTPKTVIGVYGDKGDAWYVWIRYAGQQPTQDSDMGTDPDNWMGIYSGTSSTPPTHYSSYTWFEIKGETGDTGAAASIVSTATEYQESNSGTTVPSGTWSSTVPAVTQGMFLWTRTTVTFNSGSPVVWYAVAYQAVDGEGSPGSSTPLADSGSGVVGTAVSYSREDHQHPLNVASSGTPVMDGPASRGSASTYARSDHVHPKDTSKANASDFTAFTVTLASASWSNNAQTVSNANFVASGYGYIVSPSSGSFADYAEAVIYADDVTVAGQMTFHCTNVPTSNLTVNVARMVST